MDANIPSSEQNEIIIDSYLLYDINASELSDVSIFDIKTCSIKNEYDFEHTQKHYCFIISIEGSLNIKNQNSLTKANKYEIYLKFPDENLSVILNESNSVYLVIAFNGNCASKLCAKCRFTKENRLYKNGSDLIKNSLTNLVNANKMILAKDIAKLAAFYSLFSAMIEQIEKKYQHTEKNIYILKTLEYIKENYYKHDLSLKQVSAYIDLHFNYLSQIFKSVTGISFSRYINIYRIQKACELIEKGEHFVKNIAQKVGFEDPLHFSKVFKSIKGISPKDYRVFK